MDAHKNFAYSTVATAPSPASSGTSLVVAAGDGAKFPSVPFNATVWPAGAQPTTANAEIVRVTTVSTDTFTITRTQESTSARSIVVGDQIAATITVKTFTDLEQLASDNQTGTTYTLALADAGEVVELNNSSAVTVTVPTNASIAFPVGTIIELWQQGTGQVTVSPAGGVTIRSPGGRTKLAVQYASAVLRKRATDEWCLEGNLA